MSWRFIAGALAAMIAAGVLYALLAPKGRYVSRDEFQNANYSEYRPGGSRCDPARIGALEERQALIERDRCQEAAEEYRLKREDLAQQTRSADAAAAIAELTFGQSRLMAAGTAIGFLTLVAAFFAVLYARLAAKEAKRSSNAAEGQLREVARVRAAELRPYLFIDRLEMETRPDEHFSVHFVTIYLKNYGKIPARMIRIRSHCYFTEDLAELRKDVFRKRIVSIPVCAPGHERKAFDGAHLSKRQQSAFDRRNGEIILRIRYSYKGDGKERYREEADFIYDATSRESGHFFILSETARKRRQKAKLELLEYLERREKAARDGGEEQSQHG